MIITNSDGMIVCENVRQLLLLSLERGPIVSLDRWAHENRLTPCHVNRLAHQAAQDGLIRLERQWGKPGQPYMVELVPGAADRL